MLLNLGVAVPSYKSNMNFIEIISLVKQKKGIMQLMPGLAGEKPRFILLMKLENQVRFLLLNLFQAT